MKSSNIIRRLFFYKSNSLGFLFLTIAPFLHIPYNIDECVLARISMIMIESNVAGVEILTIYLFVDLYFTLYHPIWLINAAYAILQS